MSRYFKCVSGAPEFVYDNVDSMRKIRQTLGLKQSYISLKSGIPPRSYVEYELGIRLPNRESYNRLAKVFDWEEWE